MAQLAAHPASDRKVTRSRLVQGFSKREDVAQWLEQLAANQIVVGSIPIFLYRRSLVVRTFGC